VNRPTTKISLGGVRMANVLLVDDEPDFVAAATEMLQLHGHTVESAERLESARRLLGGAAPDVLLLDLMLPDGNGLELLEELRESPVKRVVFITGHPGIKSLIKNLSGPSVSYLTKPIGSTELLRTVETDSDSSARSNAETTGNLHFGCLIGESPAMLQVYEQIEKVARTPSPVLILGESSLPNPFTGRASVRASSSPSIAAPCRASLPRASCSGTRKAVSRAPCVGIRAFSNAPTAARCSSTSSPRCRSSSNRISCACSRRAPCCPLAASVRFPSMHAPSPRRIAIRRRRSPTKRCVRICTTGSVCFRSLCRRCARAFKMSHC
jgi:CheY-like chemotaxis protein